MNYTVDIIDTQDDTHTTLLEAAEKSSLVLAWNGSDGKADQNIVGSSFKFNMEVYVANATDAHFVHLFTGNETRYKVRLYTDDETTIWWGFLLPDSYGEPYTNGTFYPTFEATDGLGRLKGKYLPDAFYTEEKSVVEFLVAILNLTGLELPLWLCPAIQNSVQKEYNLIYLDGIEFVEVDRKKNAYDVLQQILSDMLCVVYQADERWYVEGFNQRHQKQPAFEVYDNDAVWVDSRKRLKTVKAFNGLNKPFISMVPPYANVTVTHERRSQSLPDTIAKEKNEGWAVGQGVNGDVFPTYWYGNGGYLPKALSPDYKTALFTVEAAAINTSKYISLLKKIWVKRYDKMVFSGKFKASADPEIEGDITPNGMRLQFLVNGIEVYSVDRTFVDQEMEVKFDLYINNPGLLDFRIYEPFWDGGSILDGTYAANIFLEELKLERINFQENEIFTREINDDFTAYREHELNFADDAAGFSKAFRLAKIREKSTEYNEIDVPILYGRTFNGEHHSIVSLYGANLIADNINDVTYSAVPLSGLEVFYNYNNGEEMVIKTPYSITSGVFKVRRYRVKDITTDRSHWERWTDAVYPVETDRYADSVAKVFRRLFPIAHERVDFISDAAFQFNDHIDFEYVLPRRYVLTNVSWNLDSGETSGTMVRALYQNDIIDTGGTGNIPPIVNAGNDVILASNFGEYVPPFGAISLWHNTASAYDPDGFIASYLWTVESGDADASITGKTTLAPTIKKFAGNELVLRLTVTDSAGATAYDTVKFTKQLNAALVLTKTVDTNNDPAGNIVSYKYHELSFVPELETHVSLTVKGSFYQRIWTASGANYWGTWKPLCSFEIVKNGVQIAVRTTNDQGETTTNFEFNYITGDDVVFRATVATGATVPDLINRDTVTIESNFEINQVLFQTGGGEITGYPITKTLLGER